MDMDQSEMGRRIDEAAKTRLFEMVMKMSAERAPVTPIVIACIGLGAAVIFPFVCLAVAKDPPVWLFIALPALALVPLLILRASWRRWSVARHGTVVRELCVVVARSELRITINNPNHFLTLWNRTMGTRKVQLVMGEPTVDVGDVAVAVFRGDQLVDMTKIPV
jgi:hypothetical protein